MGKNETEETKKNYINCFNETIQLIEEDFKSIKSIFDKIDGQVEKKQMESNGFDSYMVIDQDIVDHCSPEYKSIFGRSCVYVFKMIDDWNVPKDFDSYYNSAKRNNRLVKQFKKSEALYVGKSYRAIERVHQHYSNRNDKISSLKLGWEERKNLKECCVMIIFFLKKELKKYRSYILPMVEEIMHQRFEPLTGSSRI